MRLVQFILLLSVATSCMAQPPVTSSLKDDLDCSNISISMQLDDCVHKAMMTSNTDLIDEIANFEMRVANIYEADPKLGKALIDVVRQAQDAWITFRDINCRVDAFEIEEGTPAYITTVNNCIIRMNGIRVEEIKRLP